MNVMISRKTQPSENTSAFSVSCTRDRFFGVGFAFDFLNPKLKPEKSVVGALVSFCRCELLLPDDPDELLLIIEACRPFGIVGEGAGSLGSKGPVLMCVSGALYT